MDRVLAHEEAIRSQVCADCIYPTGSGICGEGHAERCPLNRLLPRAVDAVRMGKSRSILDYFKSLHTDGGRANGTRDRLVSPEEAEWLIDALPLIVAAVDEIDTRLSAKKP